jgi:hypothetical protein
MRVLAKLVFVCLACALLPAARGDEEEIDVEDVGEAAARPAPHPLTNMAG